MNVSEDVKSFFSRLSKVVGEGQVSLHEPKFFNTDKAYLDACIDENFVSSVGRFVQEFEETLQLWTGAKRVVVVSSGTAALHALMHVHGIGYDDEVLVPSLTFVATANSVAMCGATPHFVDVENHTLGIDPEKLDKYLANILLPSKKGALNKITQKNMRAIVCMHTFGFACQLENLIKVAKKYNLLLIEDAAEALGTRYLNKHVGTFADGGVLSFNGNKILTTGGGGAILLNNEELAQKAKHITTTGKVPHPWKFFHDVFAFNYRMPNLNAALGMAQMSRLSSILDKKRTLASRFFEAFSDFDIGQMHKESANSYANYWLNTFLLHKPDPLFLEKILIEAHEKKIGIRPVWELLHTLPHFRECPRGDLAASSELAQRILCLPSSPQIL
jgi:perosamine synthetase